MSARYSIGKIPGDPLSWTAIPAPSHVDAVAIINGGAVNMLLRTDQADSNTEVTLKPGDTKVVGPASGGPSPRFSPGDVIAYFQPISGTGPARPEYIT